MSVTVYILDENKVFTGETQLIDEMEPTNKNMTRVSPPSVGEGQFAVYKGGKSWAVLDSYPIPKTLLQIPSVVTMRQARLQLLNDGLLDQVVAAIAALPSPEKEAAEIEWEYAQAVERGSDLVDMIAQSLSLTDEDLDNLFINASNI